MTIQSTEYTEVADGLVKGIESGNLTPHNAGVQMEQAASEIDVSYNQIMEIESKLNPHNASMFEDIYNQLNDIK